ncbi:MAG: type II toxin-antitoxin system RelE/ParE family toxin [Rikenellaceae bacterium]|nr:type II toxin-antitoxin system RelE/ParE family toxin [Rikenellaceae bacterium]
MAKYHLTNKAVEDLSNIWEYTVDTWSERQADDYYNMLIASFQKITENPQLFGLKYEEIAEGLHGYRANKHIIFYRILADEDILIIRILHQRMDLKHRVLED